MNIFQPLFLQVFSCPLFPFLRLQMDEYFHRLLGLCGIFFRLFFFFLSEFHSRARTYSYILKFTVFFLFCSIKCAINLIQKHTKYCISLLQKLHLVLFYSWIIIVIVSITSLSKFIITVLKFFTDLVSFIGHWPLLILHSWMLDFVSAFKLYCTFSARW